MLKTNSGRYWVCRNFFLLSIELDFGEFRVSRRFAECACVRRVHILVRFGWDLVSVVNQNFEKHHFICSYDFNLLGMTMAIRTTDSGAQSVLPPSASIPNGLSGAVGGFI
jgi:hypothetical protein